MLKSLICTLLAFVVLAGGYLFYFSGPAHADSPALDAKVPEGYPVATFAGGCFWCLESEMSPRPGVIKTRVGYTGGHIDNPTYKQVTTGKTGHAEAVEIYYDPGQTDYRDLVRYFLEDAHDPTQLNKQWVDEGPQYRSAIFYHDEEQKLIAEEEIARLEAENHYKKPIVTEVNPAVTFWLAEEYHQQYYKKYEEENGGEHLRQTLKRIKKEKEGR